MNADQPATEVLLGPADPAALCEIKTLLEGADLPVDDLESDDVTLLAATIGGQFVGAIGIETYGTKALLRSLVIRPDRQKIGLGRRLVEQLEDRAKMDGTTDMFLLTETATGFFCELGYALMDRGQVPEAIRSTRQFSSLCPDSADVLHKALPARR